MNQTMTTFSHNPYNANVLKRTKDVYPPQDEDCTMEPAASGLSDNDSEAESETWGRENSTLEFHVSIPLYKYDPTFRSENTGRQTYDCTRLFAGQLPYHMTPAAVMWLLWAMTGVHVVKVEKIIRWKNNRQPCGCFHVYCLPRDVETLLAANERALVDGDGVWVAETDEHVKVLQDFCQELATQEKRISAMPYRMVTLQPARSTYARPQKRAQQQQHHEEVRVTMSPPPYGMMQ